MLKQLVIILLSVTVCLADGNIIGWPPDGGGSYGANTWDDAEVTDDGASWSLAGDVWTSAGGYSSISMPQYSNGEAHDILEVQVQVISRSSGYMIAGGTEGTPTQMNTAQTYILTVELNNDGWLAFQSLNFYGTMRVLSVREVL